MCGPVSFRVSIFSYYDLWNWTPSICGSVLRLEQILYPYITRTMKLLIPWRARQWLHRMWQGQLRSCYPTVITRRHRCRKSSRIHPLYWPRILWSTRRTMKTRLCSIMLSMWASQPTQMPRLICSLPICCSPTLLITRHLRCSGSSTLRPMFYSQQSLWHWCLLPCHWCLSYVFVNPMHRDFEPRQMFQLKYINFGNLVALAWLFTLFPSFCCLLPCTRRLCSLFSVLLSWQLLLMLKIQLAVSHES